MPYSGHYVQFFDGDDDFVHAAGRFVQQGIATGCTCIVVVTPVHHEQIDVRLRALGLDPAALASEYRYITLNAQSMLATLVRDGKLDQQRFHHEMGQLIRQAASRGQPVYALGEMVSLLMEQGLPATAIRLEELWNELSRHYSFTLFCAYARNTLAGDSCNSVFKQICAVHSHVITAEWGGWADATIFGNTASQ